MLCIHTAFQSEANPFIKKWRLKKQENHPFPIYTKDEIVLGISGPGKLKTACLITYMGAIYKPLSFLNFGIAGHPTLSLGETVFGGKITDASSKKTFYPVPIIPHKIKVVEITTVEKPEENYLKDTCYDMEAFGFFHAAQLFTTAEFIHSLKVISDNKDASFKHITPSFAEELMDSSKENHICYAESLLAKCKEYQGQITVGNCFMPENFSFTVSEKLQMNELLRRYQVLSKSPLDAAFFEDCTTAKETLNKLRNKLQSLPISFL
ncbi:hypothetical protein [Criblamydia sequanensis]|uniref:Nucleoside phosphorylase domain-containing protein n=1 Tax=Candidatus Criblamydia sequanensis CRIB-18 TaxID=1437425 RepID=A0A090E3I9_9BACT|nr:hypothetical protein [Criblamydia sequanensis]CDR35139.1 hypothetical protein CSEC_2333 [Criblamydia sequanensis CRIB-18]